MMTSEPTVGDKAPNFNLDSEDGPISLGDYSGNPLVLYFYPKDDTSGCTKQAIGFSERKADFDAIGAAILGVSPDPVKSHAKFRGKHDLTISLGADPDKATLEAYGVWKEKSMYGRKYMGVERSTFLIDGNGVIRKAWRKVKVPGHVDAVLDAVKSLGG